MYIYMFTTNCYVRHDQLLTSVRDLFAQINKYNVLSVTTQAAVDRVKSALVRARTSILLFSICYSIYKAETEVVETLWQTLRRWKEVIRLTHGRCRPIQSRRGAVTGEPADAPVGTFYKCSF